MHETRLCRNSKDPVQRLHNLRDGAAVICERRVHIEVGGNAERKTHHGPRQDVAEIMVIVLSAADRDPAGDSDGK